MLLRPRLFYLFFPACASPPPPPSGSRCAADAESQRHTPQFTMWNVVSSFSFAVFGEGERGLSGWWALDVPTAHSSQLRCTRDKTRQVDDDDEDDATATGSAFSLSLLFLFLLFLFFSFPFLLLFRGEESTVPPDSRRTGLGGWIDPTTRESPLGANRDRETNGGGQRRSAGAIVRHRS